MFSDMVLVLHARTALFPHRNWNREAKHSYPTISKSKSSTDTKTIELTLALRNWTITYHQQRYLGMKAVHVGVTDESRVGPLQVS